MEINKGQDFNPYDLSEVAIIDIFYLPRRRRAHQVITASSEPVDTTKGLFAPKVEKLIPQVVTTKELV